MLNAGRLQASNAKFGGSKEEVNEVGLPAFQQSFRACAYADNNFLKFRAKPFKFPKFFIPLHRKREENRYMCTCIAEIKTSYTKVRKQAEEVAIQSFDMDDFLDAINVVKKELTRVTDATNALVELVRDHFTEITVDEAKELLVLSEPIQKKMQVVYLKLLASPLYVGLETATDLYRQAMSDFDELCHDMKTFNIDLAQDAHFQQTLKMVSEMMHR